MKDKYRLSDKFLVISSILSEESAEVDTAEFASLKDIRDKMFHGQTPDQLGMPAQRAQRLIRKYLKFHVEP